MSRDPVGQLSVATLASVFQSGAVKPLQMLNAIMREPCLFESSLSEKVPAFVRVATTSPDLDLREAAQADLFNLARRNPEAQIEIYRALLSVFNKEKDPCFLEEARLVLTGALAAASGTRYAANGTLTEVSKARDNVLAVAGLPQAVTSTPKTTHRTKPSAPPAKRGLGL